MIINDNDVDVDENVYHNNERASRQTWKPKSACMHRMLTSAKYCTNFHTESVANEDDAGSRSYGGANHLVLSERLRRKRAFAAYRRKRVQICDIGKMENTRIWKGEEGEIELRRREGGEKSAEFNLHRMGYLVCALNFSFFGCFTCEGFDADFAFFWWWWWQEREGGGVSMRCIVMSSFFAEFYILMTHCERMPPRDWITSDSRCEWMQLFRNFFGRGRCVGWRLKLWDCTSLNFGLDNELLKRAADNPRKFRVETSWIIETLLWGES